MMRSVLIILFALFILPRCDGGNKDIAKEKETVSFQYKENKDYEILYCKEMSDLTNYYVLLLWENFNEASLKELAECIKMQKSPDKDCNISIYDSKDYVHLSFEYPLKGRNYVDYAEHLVYLFAFDGSTMYYPLIDSEYKRYGGKKSFK